MADMHCPNDPIFWLHHAFFDKILTEFQATLTMQQLIMEFKTQKSTLPPAFFILWSSIDN